MQHYYRIRDLREDKDLTQEALCKKLYMHKTTYTNYEQGKHTVPLDFAVTLADFYDVSLDYIAGRSNFPKGADKSALSNDEMNVVEKYSSLTERNKGKLEQFLEQLIENQSRTVYTKCTPFGVLLIVLPSRRDGSTFLFVNTKTNHIHIRVFFISGVCVFLRMTKLFFYYVQTH